MDKKFVYITSFSFVWAIYTVLRKYYFNQGVDELNFLTWSLLFAVLIFAVYLLVFEKEHLHFGFSRQYQALATVGLIGNGLSNIFMTLGLKLSTAANFGFLVKMSMPFTIIIAYFVLREKLTRIKLILVGCMFFGAYLISTNGAIIIPHAGDILIILGALCNAIATIISRSLIKGYTDAKVVTFYRLLFGFLVTWGFTTSLNRWSFEMDKEVLMVILICSLLLISFVWLLNKTLEYATASYVTIMNMSVSVFVLLLSMIFLNETFSLIQSAGAGIIILAGIATVKTRAAD